MVLLSHFYLKKQDLILLFTLSDFFYLIHQNNNRYKSTQIQIFEKKKNEMIKKKI